MRQADGFHLTAILYIEKLNEIIQCIYIWYSIFYMYMIKKVKMYKQMLSSECFLLWKL